MLSISFMRSPRKEEARGRGDTGLRLFRWWRRDRHIVLLQPDLAELDFHRRTGVDLYAEQSFRTAFLRILITHFRHQHAVGEKLQQVAPGVRPEE